MVKKKTFHVMAAELLAEVGRPLEDLWIGEELLRRGTVTSNAADPARSIATTLDKNIRDNRYNEPRLASVLDERSRPVHGERGRRLIQLASWADAHATAESPPRQDSTMQSESTTLPIRLSSELLAHIQLAQLAGFGANQEDSAVALLKRGIEASATEIGVRIRDRFKL